MHNGGAGGYMYHPQHQCPEHRHAVMLHDGMEGTEGAAAKISLRSESGFENIKYFAGLALSNRLLEKEKMPHQLMINRNSFKFNKLDNMQKPTCAVERK